MPLLIDNTPVSSTPAGSVADESAMLTNNSVAQHDVSSPDIVAAENALYDEHDSSISSLSALDEEIDNEDFLCVNNNKVDNDTGEGHGNTNLSTPPPSKRVKSSEAESVASSLSVKSDTSTPKSSLLPSPITLSTRKAEENPLPDPFQFPAHYRPDVEIALSTGNMSRETRASFLSAIAAAMFTFKKYPTGDEYTRVACEIIKKYPFLKPPKGSPTACIKQSLVNRFKEFRRLPKERSLLGSSTAADQSMKQCKRKTPLIMKPPQIPSGEDETSFKRHNRLLILEYNKTKQNMSMVNTLMDRTYAFRRADILDNSCDVTTILSKYPFLQNVNQLLSEMQRIIEMENFQSSVKSSWIKTWSPPILRQSSVEKQKNKRLSHIIAEIPSDETDYSYIVSLVYLVYMLPEARVKPNHELVIYSIPEACDVEEAITEKGQSEPYILVIGTYQKPIQSFLIVDSTLICEVNIEDVISVLMSAFFAFNVCYTKACQNLYLFFEFALLNVNTNLKLPPSVSHLLASLHAHTL